jgi:SAM-dependent methyltransferase
MMVVRQYFAATLSNWEHVYRHRDVYATIYQERLQAALGLVDQLPLEPGRVALDVGCGPGFATTALATRGFSVHAADTVPEMVGLTLSRARTEGVRAHVCGSVCDIRALSFADASFDLVFVVGVSEWLDTLDGALAEVARVLKPAGHLVLSADNSWALCFLLDPLHNPLVVPIKRAIGAALRSVWTQRRVLRTHAYSSRVLDGALRRAGLTKRAALTLGYGPFSFFNRGVVPDRVGHALHRGLRALANGRLAVLRAAGLVHLVVASR